MRIGQRVLPPFTTLIMVVWGLGLVGCGGGDTPTPTESVTNAIFDLEDAAYDEKAFSSLFIEGSAPDNRGDYARLDIEVAGKPTVNGQTAKVPMKLTPRTGASLGEGIPPATDALPQGPVETTWTLEKSGDGWKIAAAPLQ